MLKVKTLENGIYNENFCGDFPIEASSKDEVISMTADYVKSCEIKSDSLHDFYIFDESGKRVGWFILRNDGSLADKS